MNKLETAIKEKILMIDKYHYLLEDEEDYFAKEIASIALELVEKAFDYNKDNDGWYGYKDFEQFKQEVL